MGENSCSIKEEGLSVHVTLKNVKYRFIECEAREVTHARTHTQKESSWRIYAYKTALFSIITKGCFGSMLPAFCTQLLICTTSKPNKA